MSNKVKSAVSDNSSNCSVSMLLQIEMDERILEEIPQKEVIDYSALFDPETAAYLIKINKSIRFEKAIASKIKSGGINLKYAGKNKDGEDVYRLA